MELTEPTSPPPAAARNATRLWWWLGVIAALITLNYYGRYAVEEADDTSGDLLYEWWTFGASLFQFGLILGVMLLIAGRGSFRELFALRRPRNWQHAAAMMVAIFVGTYVIAGIVGALGGDPGDEQGLLPDGWDASRAAPFVANALVIALFVPVVEELTFRGLGFSLVAARFGAAAAVVATGVLFGAGHGVLYGLPIFVGLGIGLAILRARSGSVLPGIILHALFNGVSLIVSVTYQGGG